MTDVNRPIEIFDPRIASTEMVNMYLSFTEELFRETNPDDPLPSRDLWIRFMKGAPPLVDYFWWVMFSDAEKHLIIGRGLLEIETENSPSFKNNIHVAYGGVAFSKDYRRKGLGTELLRLLVIKSNELGKLTLETKIILEDGHRFCDNLNGLKAIERFENRLWLKDVNWSMIEEWKEEGPRSENESKVELLQDLSPKDIDEYMEIINEVEAQEDQGGLESRPKATSESIENEMMRFKENGIETIVMVTRGQDSVITGVTTRYYAPEEPYRIDVGFTGVKEIHRWNGIGKWLKAEMLFYIKEQYPAVKFENATNDISNKPMLAINEQLGYKRRLIETTYKFKIAELIEKLGD